MQPLLSLGAYDIEQQRQSIRSNIQQAPAQWIVARGRRGAVTRAGTRRGGGRSRSKAAHAGSPWITALIESLSDVPWSRVILLPKQLLSSVVYSHLFHPAEPEPQTPGRHFTPSRTTSPLPSRLPTRTISHDLSPPRHPPAFGRNSHRLAVRFYRLTTTSQSDRFNQTRSILSIQGARTVLLSSTAVKAQLFAKRRMDALIVSHRFE